MGRTKGLDYMRTEFLVDVVDNVVRTQPDGIVYLTTTTGMGGIRFEAERVGESTFKVISRSNGVVNAMRDHMYLIQGFERSVGRVHDIRIMGRPSAGRNPEFTIRYIIKDSKLIPYREWENYPVYEFNDYGIIEL